MDHFIIIAVFLILATLASYSQARMVRYRARWLAATKLAVDRELDLPDQPANRYRVVLSAPEYQRRPSVAVSNGITTIPLGTYYADTPSSTTSLMDGAHKLADELNEGVLEAR